MHAFARFLTLFIVTVGLGGWSHVSADVIPIDLNDFFADPTVTVTSDGSSAAFEEDPPFLSVMLSNDPGFGDPNIIIPAPNRELIFEYDFIEPSGVGNNDSFFAFILDGTTGIPIPGFDFSVSNTDTGSHAFDLSTLVGETLGLQFELVSLAGDTAFSSTLRVSDVRLVTPDGAASEPPIVVLMLGGLMIAFLSRRNRRNV